MKLSIVIPSYNEAGNILKLHSSIISNINREDLDFEIIWVNDGSTDESKAILSTLENVIIVNLARNYGQTLAMTAGAEFATGDLLAFLDGDCQNDPADIPIMIKYLEDNDLDCVCGWRKTRKDNFSKKIISRGAYLLRQLLTSDKIHDSGCTLKVIKSEAFQSIYLSGELHRFIPSLLLANGWKVGEIPVNHLPRNWGVTKYNYRRIVKSYLDMLSLWIWGKFPGRPLHLLGSIGIIFVIIGILLIFARIYLYITNNDLFKFSLTTLSTLFLIFGLNFFFTGIILDLLNKIYLGTRSKSRYRVID